MRGGGQTPHCTEPPVLRTLPDLVLCVSSSGCSFVSFINVLCNTLAIVGKLFTCVL